MTEDEAKTRWCPMALIGTGQALAVNRGNKDYPITACVGSDCMMWRWAQRMVNEDDYNRQRFSTIGITTVKPVFENTVDGYCGLAGRIP